MFFTIKLYLHLNCVFILNWIIWNRTICIKMDLALNNLQRLICHKTQPTKQPIKRILYSWKDLSSLRLQWKTIGKRSLEQTRKEGKNNNFLFFSSFKIGIKSKSKKEEKVPDFSLRTILFYFTFSKPHYFLILKWKSTLNQKNEYWY